MTNTFWRITASSSASNFTNIWILSNICFYFIFRLFDLINIF
jgi:hypothetical protein